MTVKANTAEGLAGAANGLAITSGTQTTPGGTTLSMAANANARTTLVTGGMHGTYAYQIACNVAEQPALYYALDATKMLSLSFYFKYTSLPSVATTLVLVNNLTGAVAYARVEAGGGSVNIYSKGNVLVGSIAAAIRVGTWYRLDMGVSAGTTAANGTIRAGVFYGDQTTPVAGNVSSTTCDAGVDVLHNWQFGNPSGSGSAAFVVAFDDIRGDDGTAALAGAHGFTAVSAGARFAAVVTNPGNFTADNDFVADLEDGNAGTGVTSPGLGTNESITYTIDPLTSGSLTGTLKARYPSAATNMRAYLYQGAVKVSVDASHPAWALTPTEAPYTWTNTPAENAAITDWNDLRMMIQFNAV